MGDMVIKSVDVKEEEEKAKKKIEDEDKPKKKDGHAGNSSKDKEVK